MIKNVNKKLCLDVCVAIVRKTYSHSETKVSDVNYRHFEIYIDKNKRLDLKTIKEHFDIQHPENKTRDIISWSIIEEVKMTDDELSNLISERNKTKISYDNKYIDEVMMFDTRINSLNQYSYRKDLIYPK